MVTSSEPLNVFKSRVYVCVLKALTRRSALPRARYADILILKKKKTELRGQANTHSRCRNKSTPPILQKGKEEVESLTSVTRLKLDQTRGTKRPGSHGDSTAVGSKLAAMH